MESWLYIPSYKAPRRILNVITAHEPSTTNSESAVTQTTSAAEPVEAVVTSQTPELSPAGIDSPAVVDGASPELLGTIEELLANPLDHVPKIDPSITIDHYGQLKELGLDYGWGTTAFFEWLIEHVHITTGLGWLPSIVVCTSIIRVVLFYFQARGSDNMGKLAAMKPVLEEYQTKSEQAIRAGDKQQEQFYKFKQAEINKQAGVRLSQGVAAPLMLGVFGFGAFRCLRGMSSLPAPGMSEAGILWFTDLTIPDPYYALPAITGAIMYAVMKNGGEQGLSNQTAQAQGQKTVQTVLPIFMFVVTTFQPAAIQFYFFSSSVLGGITGRMLRMPSVRRLMHISPLPTPGSNEIFSKIIQENKPISMFRGRDGTIRYQAPTPQATNRNPNQVRGMTIKPGTKVPAHFRPVLSEEEKEKLSSKEEFQRGAPQSIMEKTKWAAKHYTPQAVIGRFRGVDEKAKTEKSESDILREIENAPKPTPTRPKVVAKNDAEVERRRRFQNRK
ncbi:hypothetical protein K504DRAFT_505522 [Pleomassaria siparia CBS 279.74]|uniref:Membrane insertase YidC/Oxa/ALB C-terminal domain-containing protein n=1 Tax=Pleomassaria siparia CBS 279.74 TaxID=1314801 RepID=A0A6G1JYU7_9PLEO|nr:hypothetical protein K504DRAFT_505522 [Pleomassaria siparia CBS 279.74]